MNEFLLVYLIGVGMRFLLALAWSFRASEMHMDTQMLAIVFWPVILLWQVWRVLNVHVFVLLFVPWCLLAG